MGGVFAALEEVEQPVDDGDAESLTVLFVDNYDSFTYNLVEYVSQLPGTEAEVLKNTASLEAVRAADPDAIVTIWTRPPEERPRNRRHDGCPRGDHARRADARGLSRPRGCCRRVRRERRPGPEPIHGKASSVNHDGEVYLSNFNIFVDNAGDLVDKILPDTGDEFQRPSTDFALLTIMEVESPNGALYIGFGVTFSPV